MGKFKTLHKSYIKVPENHRVNAQCNVSGGVVAARENATCKFSKFQKNSQKNRKNT